MISEHLHPATHSTVQINLADALCCELWVRAIADALKPETRRLDVFFLGGGELICPSALLSLRNALMLVPPVIFMRTYATCSLSPFACVPWLLGDERWIAHGARLWIPKVREEILRGHLGTGADLETKSGVTANRFSQVEQGDQEENEEEDDEDASPIEGRLKSMSRMADCRCSLGGNECGCRRRRIAVELRTLASILNEWFPCWEYAGKGITCEELIELRIVKREWVFGGAGGRRGSVRHVDIEAQTELWPQARVSRLDQD